MQKNNNVEKEYLTESSLGVKLNNLFPSHVFIHDKSVPGSKNKRFRPDYRCDALKLIVEFDGYSHYCKAKQIINDRKKDADYVTLGYRVVRIPYFVQWCTEIAQELDPNASKVEQTYPHGFIDKKAILPADFCHMGLFKFLAALNLYPLSGDDVISNIFTLLDSAEYSELVIPRSTYNIMVGL